MRSVLPIALLAALALTAPANASFSGSNGQVAYVDEAGGLRIDDPFDDAGPGPALAQVANNGQNAMTPRSAPQWSPDGTKLLFTREIDNGALPIKHSAVFVIDRDGDNLRQISHPFPGKPDSCGTCDDGESAWDTSPVWKDADTIAFIRWVAAGDNATHESQEGTTVRQTSLSGGGDSALRFYDNDDQAAAVSVIWPTGWSAPVVVYVGGGGYSLRRVSNDTTLASSYGITDVDASPDGERIAYSSLGAGGYRVHTIDKDGALLDSFDPGIGAPNWVRFAPDDNGLILPGCARDSDEVEHCGLITHRLPDPDGDIKPSEPENAPYLDMNVADIGDPFMPGNRPAFDIQSQDLPVMYVPGFLGSEIECDGEKVWMPTLPPLRFEAMRLQEDGVTNATCASAKPTGKIVDKFLVFADVYGHADDWLEEMDPPGGYKSYGWDWRKSPQQSLAELDGVIDGLLSNPLADAQGASRVSMVGHSYGALLMRTYIDDAQRAKKVARVLTVGAPYWGVPKPLFSIAFGIELPNRSAIDAFANNEDMSLFARNMAGIYHLFPSDNYGPWLRYEGDQLDQAGVANIVKTVGHGNEALLQQAWTHHRENIDGFLDYAGRIDYRSVTGVGALTIGGVDITDLAASDDGLDIKVRYENGDGTVTGRSATQGPIGTADPLGDDVHIQYRCGYLHMDQTKDETLQEAYSEFLVTGRIPRKLPTPDCAPEGEEIEIFDDLEVIPPTEPQRADGPLSLGDAEVRELADVIRLPGRTTIVTNDSQPVDLTFEAEGLSFGVTKLTGGERGPQQVVGPVTGTVVLEADGDITVDGQPVTPTPPVASPTPTPSATPSATPTPQPAAENRCKAKLAKARKALKKAKKAVRKHPSKRNRKRVAKARKALTRAKRCVP